MADPTITPEAAEPTGQTVAQAAEWLAHLESGDADEADLAAFEDWRRAHRTHAVAIDRLGGLGAQFGRGGVVERETLRRLFLRPRRRAGPAALLLLAAIGAGWLASRSMTARLYLADARTQPGETRAMPLPDGSRITLGTRSAVDLDRAAGKRETYLLRGELYAEVRKGDDRPFVIATDDGSAQAMGTAFVVRKDAGGTRVAVVESHVRVCPAQDPANACITLAPGEAAWMTRLGVTRLADAPPANAAAWVEGWLPVTDRPLVDVLDELNRWRADPIDFDRQALADLRVSGMLPLRDTDRALANLGRLLPIAVDRQGARFAVRRRPG